MADERFKNAENTATEQYAIYVDARLRVWAVPDFNFPSGRTKYVRAADYDSLRTAAQAALDELQDDSMKANLHRLGAIGRNAVENAITELERALNPKG